MPWIIGLQGENKKLPDQSFCFMCHFMRSKRFCHVLPFFLFLFCGRFYWVVWANMFLQDVLSNLIKIYHVVIIRHFSPARAHLRPTNVFGQITATNQLTLFKTLQLLGYPLRIAICFLRILSIDNDCLIKSYKIL